MAEAGAEGTDMKGCWRMLGLAGLEDLLVAYFISPVNLCLAAGRSRHYIPFLSCSTATAAPEHCGAFKMIVKSISKGDGSG
jgi:hypothetical protein